jgi:hypothetical protein
MLYPSELRGHVFNSTVWLRKCTPRFVLRGGLTVQCYSAAHFHLPLEKTSPDSAGRPSASCRQPKLCWPQSPSLLAWQAPELKG